MRGFLIRPKISIKSRAATWGRPYNNIITSYFTTLNTKDTFSFVPSLPNNAPLTT